jgi:CO/xanthine dehydrogenase FAD-binding subunit
MPRVLAYHRPTSIDEALKLLTRPTNSRLLGGGSVVTPSLHHGDAAELIDLQDLGLRGVCSDEHGVFLGAMTTLDDLAEHGELPDELRMIARREAPSTLRTIATVGGTVAIGDWESELVAALLVYRAIVRVRRSDGETDHALTDVLGDRSIIDHGVITTVRIDPDGIAASERTVRTAMDTPIVSVVAQRANDGSISLAATGVSTSPILLDPNNPAEALDPPADFRGTSAYRIELVRVLSNRVLARLTK